MSSISIDEAKRIAAEFVKKKRSSAKDIVVDEVTRFDANKTRVLGTFKDTNYEKILGALRESTFEIEIGADKVVYEYKIS